MPLNQRFHKIADELMAPGMGTENVGQFLYSLVRMTRSWRLLEVGLGYTTPFLAQALKDAAQDFQDDIEIFKNPKGQVLRLSELSLEYYRQSFSATLHAIDDYSIEHTSAPKVLEALKRLGLDDIVTVHEGDFRGMSQKFDTASLPFDLVWFDCGGPAEYVQFLEEYWPLIKPDGGILILHFTYWDIAPDQKPDTPANMVMGSIANEIRRQQAKAGLDAEFEVLSIVEPHKRRQGSVTTIRRLGAESRIRDREFTDDIRAVNGTEEKPLRHL